MRKSGESRSLLESASEGTDLVPQLESYLSIDDQMVPSEKWVNALGK